MTAYLLYILAALYLGVVTSISPCPLTTNIAAISYVGRKVGSPRAVLAAGGLYTLGRCLLYLVLALAIAETAMSVRAVSVFLQQYVHLALGPIFLVLGMFLVGLITASFGGGGLSERLQQKVDALGIWGAFFLGVLFAVSFCPTSAAWFFGLVALILGAEAGAVTTLLARIGLALPQTALPAGGAVVLPIVYGLGTALPVILVAFLLAFSAQSVGNAFGAMVKTEWWARQVTGWAFIALGVYCSLAYVFRAI